MFIEQATGHDNLKFQECLRINAKETCCITIFNILGLSQLNIKINFFEKWINEASEQFPYLYLMATKFYSNIVVMPA